jgi:HEAT repeat protein
MSLKLPRPRFSLRTMAILIAAVAAILWTGLGLLSPTRRLGRLLRADQPVYVRREAASSLGRAIPPWEVDQAIRLLIGAIEDPSPRVREYAMVGLFELGPRARQAVSKLISVLEDQDRFVRFGAARALGIIEAGSPKRADVVTALTLALDDIDPDVRVVAAEALIKLGETRRRAATLVAALIGTDSHLRSWARTMMQKANDIRPFLVVLAEELQNKDPRRRDEAYQSMLLIASPQAVMSALIAASAGGDPEIEKWAAERLKQIDPGP